MMKKALMVSCFNWYKARLEPIREFLMENGYKVSILIADFEHISKTPVRERYDECTYIHVPPYQKNLSVQRIRSHLVFGKAVRHYIDQEKPDLIWLQMPPNNPGKACIRYKKQHPESGLILDLIDLWPESMPLGRFGSTLPANMWRKWRNDTITAADYTFTECELYHDSLKDVLNPEKTGTLHLFKEQTAEEKELVLQAIDGRDMEDGTVRLAYLGSMNNIIDIDGICRVIRSFIAYGFRAELHAVGDGENRLRFETAAAETGCDVHFYGPVYDEKEKIRKLAICDFAFNMMKDTSEVGLTIKSIDYLSYGLPLINNIKGDTWDMVVARNIGLNVPAEGNITEESIRMLRNIRGTDVLDFYSAAFSREQFKKKAAEAITCVIRNGRE